MYERKAYVAFEDEFTAEFHRRMVEARGKMEQKELAAAIGCSHAMYAKYETRSPLPLCLFPTLAAVTDKPFAFWTLGMPIPPGIGHDVRRRLFGVR